MLTCLCAGVRDFPPSPCLTLLSFASLTVRCSSVVRDCNFFWTKSESTASLADATSRSQVWRPSPPTSRLYFLLFSTTVSPISFNGHLPSCDNLLFYHPVSALRAPDPSPLPYCVPEIWTHSLLARRRSGAVTTSRVVEVCRSFWPQRLFPDDDLLSLHLAPW